MTNDKKKGIKMLLKMDLRGSMDVKCVFIKLSKLPWEPIP